MRVGRVSTTHSRRFRSMKPSNLFSRFTPRALLAAAVLSAIPSYALADVVTDWNVAMTSYSEALPPPGLPPFIETRIYAMAHIAMRNALAEHGNNHGANDDAAVAQAAHDVLKLALP